MMRDARFVLDSIACTSLLTSKMNHARRSVGDRHYSQYDYVTEQRSAFEAWADFIMSVVDEEPSNIVELRAVG
jgi:hypothetical protein